MTFSIMIPIDFTVSTNARLVYNGGQARLTGEARKEKRDIYKYLSENVKSTALKDLKGKFLNVTLFYFLKQSFGARDVDNLLKTSIDGIFKYFGLNDNTIVNLVVSKRKVNDSEKEYIYFKISDMPESKLAFNLSDIIKEKERK